MRIMAIDYGDAHTGTVFPRLWEENPFSGFATYTGSGQTSHRRNWASGGRKASQISK